MGCGTSTSKIGEDNNYTANYGDPLWIYYQYRLTKGDGRSRDEVYAEGRQKMREVEARGVDLATGHGANMWDLSPPLAAKVKSLYDDASSHFGPNSRPNSSQVYRMSCRFVRCPRIETTTLLTRPPAKP